MKRRELFQLLGTSPVTALPLVPNVLAITSGGRSFGAGTTGAVAPVVLYAPCGLPAMLAPVTVGPMCKCGHGTSYHQSGGRCSWGDYAAKNVQPQHRHPAWECSCGEFSDDNGAYQLKLNQRFYEAKNG